MRRFTITYDYHDFRHGHINRRVEGVLFSDGHIAWRHIPFSYGGGAGNGLPYGEGEMGILNTAVYLAVAGHVEPIFTWIDEE